MDKASQIGQTSAVGSLHLFLGKMVSTVILAIGTIIVGMLISEGDYGLYAVALVPATTLMLFQDWGVGAAVIKYCAHYRATNQQDNLKKIISAGLIFSVTTGVILTVISLLLANFIASEIFAKPQSAFLIALVSISILFSSILGTSQSIFVGFERMKLSSYAMACQAIVQGMLAPLLVFFGYGAMGAAIGYTVALMIAGAFSLSVVYFFIYRQLKPEKVVKFRLSEPLKLMLNFGVPLALASLMSGLLIQFYSFMIASFVDAPTIGNYRIATNFGILLTFFTIPIATVLFPAFSKVDAKNDRGLLKKIFESAIKYAAFIVLPVAMAMMVLSDVLIGTLYGDKWLLAPFFLALVVIDYGVSSTIGSATLGNLLSALGETKMMMKLNIVTLLIGVPMAYFMIPQLGILGMLIVYNLAGLPSFFAGAYWTWKHYDTKANFLASAKIFFSSTVATLVTYIFVGSLNSADWIRLAAGILVFATTYLIVSPLMGAISRTDIENLRGMFSNFGFLSKVLEIPLKLMEWALKKTRAKH
ncbi:MAG: oligosaccharide flippase family protein, partial [Promethearchaeota archaeon]